MSGHLCGCDPDARWSCADLNCDYRRKLQPTGYLMAQDELYRKAAECSSVPVASEMDEAWGLTHGDRRAAYGTPQEVFEGYALMWTGLLARKLKAPISATDVTLMMTALKLAREANSAKRDNVVDAHGYLVIHSEIKG